MSRTLLYVGCYTHESTVGIRVFDASDPDGRLVALGNVEGLEHPSFLAAHPNGRVLYAVSETASFDGMDGGGVVALRIDPLDGALTPLDRAPSHGNAPCHLSVDQRGRFLYVANYGSGTVAVHELRPGGGFAGLHAVHQHEGSGPSARQAGPHVHCAVPSPDGAAVVAVDLGIDAIVRYQHTQTAAGAAFLRDEQLVLDPGSGPRHLAFHPLWPIAFVVCELDSTVHAIACQADGRMSRMDSCSTLPVDFDGDSLGAEVRVHPQGHRVYVSNRGHDSIAVFACHGVDAPLEPIGHRRPPSRRPPSRRPPSRRRTPDDQRHESVSPRRRGTRRHRRSGVLCHS